MLSIIIVNYKTPELVALCLKSLNKSIKNLENEIIIIDVDSNGDLKYELEDFKNDKLYIEEIKKNVGYSAAVNRGLTIAKGDYYLILNSDIIVEENTISELLKEIKKEPKIGLVGPKLIGFNGKSQQSAFRFYRLLTIIIKRNFL